jgi:hypothetical protein
MMHSLTNQPLTLEVALDWLFEGLGTFARHPAGSDFEEGYEQALKDMALELVGRAAEPLN